MQWLPIESAPKDGTWILLGYFLETKGGGHPVVAFWYDSKRLWCDGYKYFKNEGYFSPTHWMPLPEDPRKI